MLVWASQNKQMDQGLKKNHYKETQISFELEKASTKFLDIHLDLILNNFQTYQKPSKPYILI